ncbi:hypothetical protein FRC06_007207, partial [Ceratobasidium sp. 370]
MPASFSTYASQFLSRSTASTSAQPMFYSVAEGAESQYALGNPTHSRRSAAEFDEDGLPFLPGGETIFDSGEKDDAGGQEQEEPDSRAATPQRHFASPPLRSQQLDLENPYLDEQDLELEDNVDDTMPPDSIPLIASPPRSPSPRPRQKPPAAGWLAHLSQSGHPGPGRSRSSRAAMSPPDRTRMNSSSEDEDSDSSEDLPLFPPSPKLSQSQPHARSDATPPPPRLSRDPEPGPSHIDLTEPLLHRDGIERSVFSLPDPARTPYRKYNDPVWTALWCTSILFSFTGSIVIIFFTDSHPKTPSVPGRKTTTPFSTLTHTIPLLTLVVVLSSVFATALAAPLALLFAAVWAFGGSFMWDGDGVGETWGETVGLRLFSLIPLILAIILAHFLYKRYRNLLRGISVISLSSALVLEHPPLLALSLALLVAALVLSIPFLALIFRLMLVGTFVMDGGSYTWRVKGWAWWMAVLVTGVLMWSWAVVRGALRVTVAGVVASWYYSPINTVVPTLPEATNTTRLALLRAQGPSLGSICASALLLTISRSFLFILRAFRSFATPTVLSALPLPIPPAIQSTLIRWLVAIAEAQVLGAIVSWLSMYGGGADVQVLVGVGGDGIWSSARRVPNIINVKKARGRGRKSTGHRLLTNVQLATSLGLGVFAAIGGYIFAAHGLSDPAYAPLAALLVGAGTCATVRFCVGVVDDA